MRLRSMPLPLRPVIAVAVAAAFAVGAAGCGGSDDDSGSSGGSDGQQARQTAGGLYAALRANDGEGVCEQLNEAAQRQIEQGEQAAPGDSCAESFQKFLDGAKKSGGLELALEAKIESVEVTGDRAVAKVRFGGGGNVGEIPLEQVDGEWKLEAAGASPSN